MLAKALFENHFAKGNKDEIMKDVTAITRIDSPQLTGEKKSIDFDTSSIRSPATGRKQKKGSVYADELSAQVAITRYVIENEDFAKGAYGKVTLAVDKVSKERVVIKTVPKTTPIRMIQNEVRAGQIIGYHPNIATFHRYLEFPEVHTMIFSFVDGQDLFTYLENVNFTPRYESEARMIVVPILKALQHSHSKNIAHRDIKLENILLDSNGKASLIDYGLCAFVEDGKKSREWCGSDNYLAPEIVRRVAYDSFLADVFSTGVVLFALLFGVFPFENLRVNSRFSNDPSRPLPRLHVRFPTDVKVSRSAKDLLLGMLEDDVEKRLTLDEVLKHDWVTAGELSLPKLDAK